MSSHHEAGERPHAAQSTVHAPQSVICGPPCTLHEPSVSARLAQSTDIDIYTECMRQTLTSTTADKQDGGCVTSTRHRRCCQYLSLPNSTCAPSSDEVRQSGGILLVGQLMLKARHGAVDGRTHRSIAGLAADTSAQITEVFQPRRSLGDGDTERRAALLKHAVCMHAQKET